MRKKPGPIEHHPYGDFIPNQAKAMIIGSFPIGKFTNPDRKEEIDLEKEVDFFYGGAGNALWELLTGFFPDDLNPSNSDELKKFLSKHFIAMGDVIKSCQRVGGSASDNDLKNIVFNKDLKIKLKKNNIKKLIFTSVNARKWFEKEIDNLSGYEPYTMISPSRQAPRMIGGLQVFKKWKNGDKSKTASEYRRVESEKLFHRIFTIS